MKKKIGILALALLFLTGCSKIELTKKQFLEIADFNGYILEESLSGYEKYNYIKDVCYALNRDNAYFIQFFSLENEDYAKKFYDINKNAIIKEETDTSYVKSRSKQNYAFYHMENEENYMLVFQAKENVLYFSAPLNYINEIDAFLDELGIDY